MALGNTNISVTLVKNVLGESTTTVAGLVQSENVNPWGYNLPLQVEQNRYFGKVTRTAPFELGSFRNYEHNWRCYSINNPTISSNLAYYESGNLVVNLKYFPVESSITSGVQHVFDVYFARTNDFTHATHTQILDNTIINDNGVLTIPINPLNPPDGGAALSPNSSVYFKIKHVSSPSRRWDKNQFQQLVNVITPDADEDDSYIIKVNLGQDIFNYYTDFFKTSGTNAEVWKYAGSGQMRAYLTLRNGNKGSNTINVSFEINNQSDFLGTTSDIFSSNFTIPAATRSGSTLILGTVDVVIYLVNAFSHWNVGQQYYGRVKINSSNTGTFFTGWQTGYNGTILGTPPAA